MGDEIARLHPRRFRRGAVHRRDHLYEAVFLRHLDAEAAEGAARLHPHIGRIVGRQVVRMRIERHQHAVDRRLDQFRRLDLFDILRADALEHITKQVELLVDRAAVLGALGNERPGDLRGQHRAGNRAARRGHEKFLHICSGLSIFSTRKPLAGVNGCTVSSQFYIKRLRRFGATSLR